MKEYIMELSDALVNEETGEMCLKATPVKELIRCKDCAYYANAPKSCSKRWAILDPDDYCSYAERR